MSARKKQEMWEREDFEDIRSHSSGEPPQYDWMVNRARRPVESTAPRQRPTGARPSRSRNAKTSGGRREPSGRGTRPNAGQQQKRQARQGRGAPPRDRREQPPRKRRKPVSKAKRRALVVLLALGMLLGMGFLAESLLFRVTEIQVTGDPVYAEEDVLKICGFSVGDNLLLLPTADREEKLASQLPYVAGAKISRKIPGTVVIEITAARGVCCLESGGAWCVVDSQGKVLEVQNAPKAGIMQVSGLSLSSAQAGQVIEVEDEAAGAAFYEIAKTIDELGAAEQFTRLDLSDLYDIRLVYQDRVECVLGNTSQLAAKVQYAHGSLTGQESGIKPEERGVLDLTYLPSRKRAFFDPDGIVGGRGQGQQQPPATATATPEPEGAATPGPDGESSGGRGGDIPDQLFGGE